MAPLSSRSFVPSKLLLRQHCRGGQGGINGDTPFTQHQKKQNEWPDSLLQDLPFSEVLLQVVTESHNSVSIMNNVSKFVTYAIETF